MRVHIFMITGTGACHCRPYRVYILGMSIRQGLLALLEQGPMYGYQLRAEFESRTGATWPLNVGQVYTTLGPPRARRAGRAARRRRRGPRGLPDHRRRPGRGRAPGSTPRSAGPARRATSWRSSWRWRSPCPASTSAPSCRASAPRRMRALQDYTRLKAQAADGDRTGRPGLAAGPGLAGLRGRGRGPLAGPLRGPAGRARPPTRPADRAVRRRTGDRTRRRRYGDERPAVLELRDRRPGSTAHGATEVHALRGVTCRSPPASWSP